MRRNDIEYALIGNVPDIILKEAKALVRVPDDLLSPAQSIQRKLISDIRMKKIWDLFSALPSRVKGNQTQLFFEKCPSVIAHAEKLVRHTGREAQTKLSATVDKLIRAKDQTEALAKTLKSLDGKSPLYRALRALERELDDALHSACADDSPYWDEIDALENLGRDYCRMSDFRKKGARNAIELHSIRGIYLLLRECGFKKPSLTGVGDIVAVVLGADYIDRKRVSSLTADLKGRLSFQKERRLSPMEVFGKH